MRIKYIIEYEDETMNGYTYWNPLGKQEMIFNYSTKEIAKQALAIMKDYSEFSFLRNKRKRIRKVFAYRDEYTYDFEYIQDE